MLLYALAAIIDVAIWTWLLVRRREETARVPLFRAALVVLIVAAGCTWGLFSAMSLMTTGVYVWLHFLCGAAQYAALALVLVLILRELRPFARWKYATAAGVVAALVVAWPQAWLMSKANLVMLGVCLWLVMTVGLASYPKREFSRRKENLVGGLALLFGLQFVSVSSFVAEFVARPMSDVVTAASGVLPWLAIALGFRNRHEPAPVEPSPRDIILAHIRTAWRSL